MVQEMPSSVPEELYNLTQLAEVSIAAGKLSTAAGSAAPGDQYHPHSHHNHSHHHLQHHHYPYEAIKYYTLQQQQQHQHESAGYHPMDYYQHAISYHSHQQRRDDNTDEGRDSPSPSPLASPVQQLQQQHQQQQQSYSATKKKWKTNWEINRSLKLQQQQQQAHRINKIRDVADEQRGGTAGDYGDDSSYETASLTYYTSTIRPVEDGAGSSSPPPSRPGSSGGGSISGNEDQPLDGRRSSYAASEESSEDSSYSYAHKVFDRKKSRTLSWNSGSSYGCHSDESQRRLDGGAKGGCREELRAEYGLDDQEYHGELAESSGRGASSGDELGSADDVHSCPECGKKYSTSSNLARHRQTHRSLQDKKARRCPHCSKVYVSMPAYSMHVRTHNQGCQCPTCGKCFSRPWLLQGHIRTHTGEKPFKCSVCQKAFADKSNLRAHVQTHSNTKPHSCARCGKAFALKSYLYKHEDSSCMKNKSGPGKHHSPKSSAGHPVKARRSKAEKDHGGSLGSSGNGKFGDRPYSLHGGFSPLQEQQQHQLPMMSSPQTNPIDLALQTELQLKKDAVRAKIREVLEDNCKKSAQLKAARAAAAAVTVATDNRISVIRTTASSHQESVRYGEHPVDLGSERSHSSRSSSSSSSSSSGNSSSYEYPRNYAIIA